MSERKTNSEALKRARKIYREKTMSKTISFNIKTEADLLEAAAKLKNFAGWVKMKLREEIEKNKI